MSPRPSSPRPSSLRRGAIWCTRALFAAALLFELIALHFPTPSGVSSDPEAAEAVRGAWSLLGRIARAGGRVLSEVAPDGAADLLSPFLGDKTIHLLVFLPLGLLWALERRLTGRFTRRTLVLGLLGLTAYAALGEASQVFGGRFPDPGDFVANVVGAVLGVGVVALYDRWRSRAQPPTSPATASR